MVAVSAEGKACPRKARQRKTELWFWLDGRKRGRILTLDSFPFTSDYLL